MKFRDGMWLAAEGKRLEYAEEVYSITPREDGKALSLLCPTRKIMQRADTLNLSTLTVVSIQTRPYCIRTLLIESTGHRSSF
jgi:alpha-D-xyloside xylohydrolase